MQQLSTPIKVKPDFHSILLKRELKSRPPIEQSQEILTQSEFKYRRNTILQYDVIVKALDKLVVIVSTSNKAARNEVMEDGKKSTRK